MLSYFFNKQEKKAANYCAISHTVFQVFFKSSKPDYIILLKYLLKCCS